MIQVSNDEKYDYSWRMESSKLNYLINWVSTMYHTQQTRGVEPVLVWCWASAADGGPALDQHWVNISCLLGRYSLFDQFLVTFILVTLQQDKG